MMNGEGVADTDPGAEGNPVLLTEVSLSTLELEVYGVGNELEGAGDGGCENVPPESAGVECDCAMACS